MRRIMFISTVTAIMLLALGCGHRAEGAGAIKENSVEAGVNLSENLNDDSLSIEDAAEITNPRDNEETEAAEDAQTQEETEVTEVPESAEDGGFVVDGIDVTYNSNVDALLDSLGEPRFKDTGHEVEYYDYDNGLDIAVLNDNGQRDILEIHLFVNDAVETARGLKIGDSIETVIEKYGEAFKETDDGLVHDVSYDYDNYTFTIIFDYENNVESFYLLNKETGSKTEYI